MLWTSSVLPSPDLTVRNGSCLFLCFGWVMPAVVWIPTSTLTDWTCFDLRCLSQWILSPWWSSLRGVYCFTAYISLLFHVLTRPWERKVRVYSLLYLHTWPEDDIKPKINLLTWLTSITGRENSALLSPLHGSASVMFYFETGGRKKQMSLPEQAVETTACCISSFLVSHFVLSSPSLGSDSSALIREQSPATLLDLYL